MVDKPDMDEQAPPTSRKLPKILRDSENLKQDPRQQKQFPKEPEPEPGSSKAPPPMAPTPKAPLDDKVDIEEEAPAIEPESELVLKIPKEEDKPKPVIQPKITESKSKLRVAAKNIPEVKVEEEPKKEEKKKESKISFNKRPGLKLKSKSAPSPIPTFKPATIPEFNPSGRSSVELAHSDPKAMASKKPVEPEFTGKVKKILSLKLIITLAAVVICWSAGIFWVLRPEPTAASIVAEVITLNRARKIIIEPKMVFYQLDVDPVHQERYIQNLKLKPISEESPLIIPTYHALDTWEKPNVFIRPPYADVEVEEWWDLRKRVIRYGFTKKWEDGSALILDFESDTIIGWTQAKLLSEVLN